MKRFAAACAGLLVVALGIASSAAAGPTGSVTRTPFKLDYGPISCAGVRIVTTGPESSIEDQEVCFVTADILPAGRYDATAPPVGPWCSDFDGFSTCNQAISGTVVVFSFGPTGQIWLIDTRYAQP